jgi:hypothetical protein
VTVPSFLAAAWYADDRHPARSRRPSSRRSNGWGDPEGTLNLPSSVAYLGWYSRFHNDAATRVGSRLRWPDIGVPLGSISIILTSPGAPQDDARPLGHDVQLARSERHRGASRSSISSSPSSTKNRSSRRNGCARQTRLRPARPHSRSSWRQPAKPSDPRNCRACGRD